MVWDGMERRKQAFEKKFEIDEELKFKAIVRATRLFGAWVATQMELEAAEAEVYALQMMDLGLGRNGQDEAMKKAELDLLATGVPVSHHMLEKEFDTCLNLARQQVGAIS